MGCLLPCFGTCNHRKSRKSSNPASSSHQKHGIAETLQVIEEPIHQESTKINPSIKDSIDKDEEKSNGGITKKEVPLDLNEETHEEILTQEAKECNSLGSEKDGDDGDEKQELSDSSMSSVFTYPPSHEHHNSKNNGDEIVEKEESSESFFSLSVDSRRRRSEVYVPETEEKEVNSPMAIDLSADEKKLRPIKLISRIKNTTLVTPIGFENQEKENRTPERREEMKIPFSSEEANLKVNGSKVGVEEEEIGIETSLSSWLVGFGTKPISENSPESVGNSLERDNEPRKRGGRAILGEINGEILENSSKSCSGRSLDCNLDENSPIVGKIGWYWSHTEKAILEPVSGSSCKPRPKDVCV